MDYLNQICIQIDVNIRNERKDAGQIRGCTYKITVITAANYNGALNSAPN